MLIDRSLTTLKLKFGKHEILQSISVDLIISMPVEDMPEADMPAPAVGKTLKQ